jgi:KR domain
MGKVLIQCTDTEGPLLFSGPPPEPENEEEAPKEAPTPIVDPPIRVSSGSLLNFAKCSEAQPLVPNAPLTALLAETVLLAVLQVKAVFTAEPERSYLITGGLGGFGLALAVWLATKGARQIIISSKRCEVLETWPLFSSFHLSYALC